MPAAAVNNHTHLPFFFFFLVSAMNMCQHADCLWYCESGRKSLIVLLIKSSSVVIDKQMMKLKNSLKIESDLTRAAKRRHHCVLMSKATSVR